ncbi:hypothetical protein HOL34_01675 [bacterium]|nr:hypothetical protein [bacterium]
MISAKKLLFTFTMALTSHQMNALETELITNPPYIKNPSGLLSACQDFTTKVSIDSEGYQKSRVIRQPHAKKGLIFNSAVAIICAPIVNVVVWKFGAGLTATLVLNAIVDILAAKPIVREFCTQRNGLLIHQKFCNRADAEQHAQIDNGGKKNIKVYQLTHAIVRTFGHLNYIHKIIAKFSSKNHKQYKLPKNCKRTKMPKLKKGDWLPLN